MADDGRKYGSQNNDEQQQRDAYRTMDLRMAGADVLAAWLRGGPIDAVQERFGFDRAVLV
jgi:hypothetical protein